MKRPNLSEPGKPSRRRSTSHWASDDVYLLIELAIDLVATDMAGPKYCLAAAEDRLLDEGWPKARAGAAFQGAICLEQSMGEWTEGEERMHRLYHMVKSKYRA
jgi:hypothetical protein